MQRGEDVHKSIPANSGTFWIAALGNTTNPPTLPVNGPFTPTTGTYPLRGNGISKLAAEAPTRTSAGIYVITYAHQLPVVWFATGAVLSAGGSPTAQLLADATIINAATRQITVKVTTPSGTLTDLGTSDMLVLKCDYQNSGA